jgi:hypothetical protein
MRQPERPWTHWKKGRRQFLFACECVAGTSASTNFNPKVALAVVFSSTGVKGVLTTWSHGLTGNEGHNNLPVMALTGERK